MTIETDTKWEPHKIKTIKQLNITKYNEREVHLREAGYNTFNIPSSHITFDMISEGTSAQSQEQESGILIGDEAYAGSRNFEKLAENSKKIFGHKYLCPTHNLNGSHKLISTISITEGDIVCGNDGSLQYIVTYLKGKHVIIKRSSDEDEKSIYRGNLDLVLLEDILNSGKVKFVYLNAFAGGYKAISIDHLRKVVNLTKKYQTITIINSSQLVELAVLIKENEEEYKKKEIKEIVKEIVEMSDVSVIDAAQDARCNIGGAITTNNLELYEKYMNEVVVYEGLHTYGGMAGRTMEIFSRGLEEMLFPDQANWISYQILFFSKELGKVPHYIGADGVYLLSKLILPKLEKYHSFALSAGIYLKSGIRCTKNGYFENDEDDVDDVLPVQIPRLALTNHQLYQIAKSIRELYEKIDQFHYEDFRLENEPIWSDEAIFQSLYFHIEKYEIFEGNKKVKSEPYQIKTFEYVGVTTREQREKLAREVGFNTFLLPSKEVTIDLLTDSGTSSQSRLQWSSYLLADETPSSSIDYFHFVKLLKEITGYEYIIPTHQGRAAEHIMSQALIRGGVVPGNMYFTTTKLHQEIAGGEFVDVIVDEAHIPTSNFLWKGNIDMDKLKRVVDKYGAENIPYISFEFSVNMAGGQPVSMQNAKEVYLYCKSKKIAVMFDATRAAENAYMIKKNDPLYSHSSIKEILREMFSYGDGCTVSSKKDCLVNIGGFLGIRDDKKFYKKANDLLRRFEGSSTSGGLSAGDIAAHYQGVLEMIDFFYISSRVEQTSYLGHKLLKAGIPVVEPIGTHAVFLDARRFLPHIDQDNYPAQSLASALYVECGVRSMERGNVSKGRAPNGQNYRPKLELVRLTIPRRVYTHSHMNLIYLSILHLYELRKTIKPLSFVYEPKNLRFFQGRFAVGNFFAYQR